MTAGIRIRDANTNAIRLNVTDYTVRVIYSTVLTITGNGALAVPDVSEGAYGAFLIPCFQFGYPAASIDQFMATNPAIMPRTSITPGQVNWVVGAGHIANTWQLMVVKYL
ncbi:hypothetical protein ABQX22_13755 [Xanthomonas sp. WHRI 1810A]|uniref:hypothetical protein n=1 Tax=Xanthomonas sp. WHRI 1810A TaxID=3161565 RepID=UPI0032E88540